MTSSEMRSGVQPDLIDRSRGSIVGALLGDSIGSFLEFSPSVTELKVQQALDMPGGGHWGVSPGQVTDDGEMTLAALRAFLLMGPTFDEDKLAQAYIRWARTNPFDTGRATSAALCWSKRGKVSAEQVRSRAAVNNRSLSNGSLMRASAIALYTSSLTSSDHVALEEAAKIVRSDVSLTHPNPVVFQSTMCYCVALGVVIETGNADEALLRCRTWLRQQPDASVMQWFVEAVESDATLSFGPQIGYAKYAFQHAMRHLAKKTPYIDAIRQTLAGGGDTDTNCCIVGGLLGALWGYAALPPDQVNKLLACDTTSRLSRTRPAWLRPGPSLLEEIDQLVLNRVSRV